MAPVNRFYNPSLPTYTSQFVEDKTPWNEMLALEQNKIQRIDQATEASGKVNAIIGSLQGGAKTQDIAPQIRDQYMNEVKGWQERWGDNMANVNAVRELTQLNSKFLSDPVVQKVMEDKKNYDYFKQLEMTAKEGDVNVNINPVTGKYYQIGMNDPLTNYSPFANERTYLAPFYKSTTPVKGETKTTYKKVPLIVDGVVQKDAQGNEIDVDIASQTTTEMHNAAALSQITLDRAKEIVNAGGDYLRNLGDRMGVDMSKLKPEERIAKVNEYLKDVEKEHYFTRSNVDERPIGQSARTTVSRKTDIGNQGSWGELPIVQGFFGAGTGLGDKGNETNLVEPGLIKSARGEVDQWRMNDPNNKDILDAVQRLSYGNFFNQDLMGKGANRQNLVRRAWLLEDPEGLFKAANEYWDTKIKYLGEPNYYDTDTGVPQYATDELQKKYYNLRGSKNHDIQAIRDQAKKVGYKNVDAIEKRSSMPTQINSDLDKANIMHYLKTITDPNQYPESVRNEIINGTFDLEKLNERQLRDVKNFSKDMQDNERSLGIRTMVISYPADKAKAVTAQLLSNNLSSDGTIQSAGSYKSTVEGMAKVTIDEDGQIVKYTNDQLKDDWKKGASVSVDAYAENITNPFGAGAKIGKIAGKTIIFRDPASVTTTDKYETAIYSYAMPGNGALGDYFAMSLDGTRVYDKLDYLENPNGYSSDYIWMRSFKDPRDEKFKVLIYQNNPRKGNPESDMGLVMPYDKDKNPRGYITQEVETTPGGHPKPAEWFAATGQGVAKLKQLRSIK